MAGATWFLRIYPRPYALYRWSKKPKLGVDYVIVHDRLKDTFGIYVLYNG